MNSSLRRVIVWVTMGLAMSCLSYDSVAQSRQAVEEWEIHSENRPRPSRVDPGPARGLPVPPPSDAVVLFGGKDLSAWQGADGGPAPWAVKDGYFVVTPDSGAIETRQSFGDVQLHLEWAVPEQSTGEGQHWANNGVFLMGTYEVQILESYQNETYPDGQAAAIYGQYPPLVNASRPPGQWQTYDIIFHRPRFSDEDTLLKPATMTVFHNGVLVQDQEELTGPTSHGERPPYQRQASKLPLKLQDHGQRVRFRNIWVRELGAE